MDSKPLAEQCLLDLSEVVSRTGLSARTWRRILASGRIGFLRIGGSVRIPEGELETYLRACFQPARVERRLPTPTTIEDLLDQHAPRRRQRGRPRIVRGAGRGEGEPCE